VAPATPLERAPESIGSERPVFLKREDLHELGAFKWRGALPALEAYRNAGATGVVTASTGNHGAATAWAARRLGLEATVFVPKGAARAKLALIASQGAAIVESGSDFDRAKDAARAFARERGLRFFEDGDEPLQETGYGAIASELLEQCPVEPAAVVVPVGNGALAAGIGAVLRRERAGVTVVGAVAKDAPVMEWSYRAGRAVPCDRAETVADGLAVRVAIPRAVEALRRSVHRLELVSERELARALGRLAAAGIRVEAAAAAGIALLPRLPEPGPVVLVVTGRNIDDDLWKRAVERPESFPT